MKKIASFLTVLTFGLTFSSCQKDDLNVIDVPFSSDKIEVGVGELVTFTVGSGADASSIFTGDAGYDFQKSRIALVEQKGYTEDYLRTNLVAERIPGLKEYLFRVPLNPTVTPDFTFEGSEIKIYDGKLVTWDVSNSTKSKYFQLELQGGKPQVFSIKPNKAVVPEMLKYKNNNLSALGALRNVADNTFQPFCAFPDGFTKDSQTGQSVRFGIQLIIDGKESRIDYFTLTVRELLDNLNLNMGPMIIDFLSKNPTANAANGIDEIKFIINADDPTKTDDDGDLLDYKGKMYIQEIRVGSADNMIKAFDKGTTLPYVYAGKDYKLGYKYAKAGSYTATLVSTFVGRKQYTGDGYKTGRADEILASEYPLERTYKTVNIVVK